VAVATLVGDSERLDAKEFIRLLFREYYILMKMILSSFVVKGFLEFWLCLSEEHLDKL
jgi:hypothetical protein